MLSCVDGGVVVIVMFDAGADRVCARQPLQMAVVHDARRGILGVLGVLDGSQSLGQIVYKANPSDPAVVGGTILTMMLLGAAASAIPARRALSADPSKLMRQE